MQVWCNILCVASLQDNPMECFTLYVSNNHGIVDIVEMVPISYII